MEALEARRTATARLGNLMGAALVLILVGTARCSVDDLDTTVDLDSSPGVSSPGVISGASSLQSTGKSSKQEPTAQVSVIDMIHNIYYLTSECAFPSRSATPLDSSLISS